MVAISGMLVGGSMLRTGQCRTSPFKYCWLGGVSKGYQLGVSWLYITFTAGIWNTPQPSLFGGTCGNCSGAGSDWTCLRAFPWLILTSWKICCLPGTGQQSVSTMPWRTWTSNSYCQTWPRTGSYNPVHGALLANLDWLDFFGTRFRMLNWLPWFSPTLWRTEHMSSAGQRRNLALFRSTRTRRLHHRTRSRIWNFSLVLFTLLCSLGWLVLPGHHSKSYLFSACSRTTAVSWHTFSHIPRVGPSEWQSLLSKLVHDEPSQFGRQVQLRARWIPLLQVQHKVVSRRFPSVTDSTQASNCWFIPQQPGASPPPLAPLLNHQKLRLSGCLDWTASLGPLSQMPKLLDSSQWAAIAASEPPDPRWPLLVLIRLPSLSLFLRYCEHLSELGGSPPTLSQASHPSGKASWPILRQYGLLLSTGPAGPRIYEQCRSHQFLSLPTACELHTPTQSYHCLMILVAWARISAPHLRSLIAPALMDEEGSEGMEDPDPDSGPPRKRVKTTRDYEREARRPDKRTRQMLKRGAPSLGSTTAPSIPRTPRTPRPLTVFGGGHREPREPSWPPPLPPSRNSERESAPSTAIAEPRTPSPPQDAAEAHPDMELEPETDSVEIVEVEEWEEENGPVEKKEEIPEETDGEPPPAPADPPPKSEVPQALPGQPSEVLPSTLKTEPAETEEAQSSAPEPARTVKTKAMPRPPQKARLWRPRRLSMAPPVQPTFDPPPRQIKGSVGRLLKQKHGASTHSATSSGDQDSRNDDVVKRTTAAKTKIKPEGRRSDVEAQEVQHKVEGGEDDPKETATSEDPNMPSSSSRPELVVPVEAEGQLTHFTSVGHLRAGPHPHDPETTLWWLKTAGEAPDIALTQMPLWIKQALQRPPLTDAPPPPGSRRRRRAKRESPSSSSPEIEVLREVKGAASPAGGALDSEKGPAVATAVDEAASPRMVALEASANVSQAPATGAEEPQPNQHADEAHMLAFLLLCANGIQPSFSTIPSTLPSSFLAALLPASPEHVHPYLRPRYIAKTASQQRCGWGLLRLPKRPGSLLLGIMRVRSAQSALYSAKQTHCSFAEPLPPRAHYRLRQTQDHSASQDPTPLFGGSRIMDDSDSDLLPPPTPDSALMQSDRETELEEDPPSLPDPPYQPINTGTPIQELMISIPQEYSCRRPHPVVHEATHPGDRLKELQPSLSRPGSSSDGTGNPSLTMQSSFTPFREMPPAEDPGMATKQRLGRNRKRICRARPSTVPHLRAFVPREVASEAPSAEASSSSDGRQGDPSEHASASLPAALERLQGEGSAPPTEEPLDLPNEYHLSDLGSLSALAQRTALGITTRPPSSKAAAKMLVRAGFRCSICFARRTECHCSQKQSSFAVLPQSSLTAHAFPSKLKVAAPRLSEKETYQDTDLQKTTCLRKFRPATRR